MVVKSPLEYGVVPTDWPIQDGADRTPYVGPTQAGILTKIIYPTKGYTEFAYEQNNYSNLDASTTTDLPIGGLRIQKITSKGSDVADRVLSYEYLDGTRSSGKRMSPTKNYYYWPKAFSITCNAPGYQNGYSDFYHCYVLVRTSYSNLPLGDGAQGQFVGYSTVTEFNGLSGASGKTVYRFKNVAETVPFSPITITHPAATPVGGTPNDIPPGNGLPLSTDVYRNAQGAFKIVSRTTNTYDFTNIEKIKGMNYMQEYCSGLNPGDIPYMVKFYDYVSSWIKLVSTVEEQYDQNSESAFFSTTTNFHYETTPVHYQPTAIEKVLPDGKTITTYLKYPADYTNPANSAIAAMANAWHMHSLPVETYTTVKTGTTESVTAGQFIEYGLVGTRPLPVQIKQFRAAAPVLLSSFSPTQYQVTAQLQYDPATGDVLNERQTTSATPQLTDAVKSYQWGYQNQLLTAAFSNASRSQPDPSRPGLGNEASYIGFESGTVGGVNPEEDYWDNALGATSHPTTTAHTGRFAWRVGPVGRYDFNYGPTRTFRPDHNDGKYRLSAWVRTEPNFQAGAGRLVLSVTRQDGSQVNGFSASFDDTNGQWQYVEKEIDLSAVRTAANLSPQLPLQVVAFSCNAGDSSPNLAGYLIDDVRFEPVNSLATTYTYDAGWRQPLSVSDANNRPTYYEYDDLGRLRLVRDHLRQILKHYEYHYKR